MHAIYFDPMITMIKDHEKEGWDEHKLQKQQLQVINFKRSLVKTISKHCNSALITVMFHLQDHVVEFLRVFGALFVFDASPLKQYSVSIKQAYKQTSQERGTYINETMNRDERQLNWSKFALITQFLGTENQAKGSKQTRLLRDVAFLVRDGEKVVISRLFSVLTE